MDHSEGPTTSTLKLKSRPVELLVQPSPDQKTLRSPASMTTTPGGITPNRVGQSVFYDCIDGSPLAEKNDSMKPEKSDTEDEDEISDIDQECTVFSGVTYLGIISISSPKSETEVKAKIAELNALNPLAGISVSISVPSGPEGVVV